MNHVSIQHVIKSTDHIHFFFHLASLAVHCNIRNKKKDRFQQNCKHEFGSYKSLVPPKANIPPWRSAWSILTQQMFKLRLQHSLLLHLWPSRNLHVCLTPISFTSRLVEYKISTIYRPNKNSAHQFIPFFPPIYRNKNPSTKIIASHESLFDSASH